MDLREQFRSAHMRNRLRKSIALAVIAAFSVASGESDEDVKALPLSMITQLDGGQVVHGTWNSSKVDESFIQRTSVWITQELAIGSRLNVRAGVGGLFWYATPGPTPGFSEVGGFVALTKFGPGISRVDMSYRFGDPQDPLVTLQAGLFPYKYNPDAKNLGEYLLRSGAYPAYLVTGGWNILSEAGYMMQGLRLESSFWDGKLRSELLFPMERDLPPNGDISPTFIGTVAPVKGIEVGAGVSCHHCIAVRPSKTSPKMKRGSAPQATIGFGNGWVIPNPTFDATKPVTEIDGGNPKFVFDSLNFYTFQGVKLMARASFDPKAFISMDALGPQDLRLFAEVSLLGVKNYPFYYEKASERMPIMFGFNLPAFRLLDVVSVQAEYFPSPFLNTLETAYRYSSPTVTFLDSSGISREDPNLFDPNQKMSKDDDWKWSVFARKTLFHGLNLYAQVARDHLRLPTFTAENSWAPVTQQPSEWYYLLRLELGI
jgi:hypothetical protein